MSRTRFSCCGVKYVGGISKSKSKVVVNCCTSPTHSCVGNDVVVGVKEGKLDGGNVSSLLGTFEGDVVGRFVGNGVGILVGMTVGNGVGTLAGDGLKLIMADCAS